MRPQELAVSPETLVPNSTDAPSAAPVAGSAAVRSPSTEENRQPRFTRPFRRQRESRACNACRTRKTKCDTSRTGQCSSCVSAGIVCEVADASSSTGSSAVSERRLRELEQTLRKVSERVENIPGASRVNVTGSSSNHTVQGSQTRVPTPNSSITGAKRTADVLSDSGSASEAIDTDRLRRRRRSTHGSSSLQSYVTGDGKKAHYFFGATSEMVFLDNVREYVQQLGYELPSSRALWSPSLESVRQDAIQSNLSAELRSQLPPQPLGAKLLEVYSKSVQAHTPMLYWPSILIKFQRIYTGSSVHYDHDQIVADFSILMMVWAVGAQMSDLAEVRHTSGRQMKNGWEFFEAAQRYHGGRLIKAFYTLDDAIISLLMSVYLMGASLPSPCWVMTGITSRIVQDLGLHKRPSPHQLFNVEIESRNRLFWGAYLVDRVAALTCGRPVSLLDEDCDVDLPNEIDNKGTTASESVEFFRASISVTINLDAIIQFGAISHYEDSDMETMKKIDAQLFTCWQKYPGGLCDPSETSTIEPSTLKLVFVGQQARLALFSRHFTDSTLSGTMRSFCLKKSIEIATLTASIMHRVAHAEKWEDVFSHRCNDMVFTHIFRASIVLLLAYRLHSMTPEDVIHNSNNNNETDSQTAALAQHIIILWRGLRSAAKGHISAAKSLEVLHVFADTLSFNLEAPREDTGHAPPPSVSTHQPGTYNSTPEHQLLLGDLTPSVHSTVVPLPHLSSLPVCVDSSIHDHSHNNDIAGINADNLMVGEEDGPLPDYHNFDSSEIRWDMLKDLLNVESRFGMYLGGSILEGREGGDMRVEF
ncbi:hypothetical protein VE03_03446 [Pseudogymnoascus sp. 23342-1-I1]|nr:hypothetical protein VE03_03446 [Pseudogymnoascus sp. 23342-1-I1]